MDADGYIKTWNKGAEKTKGYTESEIIGKHFSIFYTPADVADKKPERELEIAKKVGRVEDEYWRVRKDGSRFWANVVITALYDKQGKLQGFAKVTRNLTERKGHEDNLRAANALLQNQQDELQRLNESKDEFISLASHQLRTPATAVKQLLGLVLEGFEGDLSPRLLPIVKKAYDSNQRQIEIVNSLLSVAQIDAGRVTLRRANSNINNVLDSIVKQYEGVIAERGQAIVATLSPKPLLAHIDEHYFSMVIENILDNASKYTPQNGTIALSVERSPEYICILIKDNGVGISEDHLPLLYEKFRRIPNELSHVVAGSGLGLYWAAKVVELHDGRLEVESKLGEGTTFKVYVPVGKSNA